MNESYITVPYTRAHIGNIMMIDLPNFCSSFAGLFRAICQIIRLNYVHVEIIAIHLFAEP